MASIIKAVEIPAAVTSPAPRLKRFYGAVIAYATICLLLIAGILIHGDGPHPRVLSVFPANGDRYFPGGPARISFSQSMDESSVERAVQVSPGTQGQGAWFGNILNLQPVGDWRPGVAYHVRLIGKVTDDQGRPLPTPFSFWFRVHHVTKLGYCTVQGVRTVCDETGGARRPLLHPAHAIGQYALSSDGTLLAYTEPDSSGLPHLFVMRIDGGAARQLTHGSFYADSGPYWAPGDTTSITYERRSVIHQNGRVILGKPHLWNVETDGSLNAPL